MAESKARTQPTESKKVDLNDATHVLSKAEAIVELVRHYVQSDELQSELLRLEEVQGTRLLPKGCFWPGEVDDAPTIALYAASEEIRTAKNLLEQFMTEAFESKKNAPKPVSR